MYLLHSDQSDADMCTGGLSHAGQIGTLKKLAICPIFLFFSFNAIYFLVTISNASLRLVLFETQLFLVASDTGLCRIKGDL